MTLLAIPFGLGIGLSLGMLGGGGSVLAVPVLVYVLGQTVHEAITTSSCLFRDHFRGSRSRQESPANRPFF